ncbi:MAG: sigma 54-interacting transcriptional regulator [Deltaproteobacteria bacterium]|nr:sigma 54-interacting transcriptional regulator [Deltaproteobacteria bacterium]
MSLSIAFRHHGLDAFEVPLPPRGSLSIGRAPDCAVCLPDPERLLSRLHCELRRQAAGVMVVDRSANGVRLGGTRLRRDTPRLLRPGQELALPGWTLVLKRAPTGRLGSTLDRRSDDHSAPEEGGLCGISGAAASMQALFRQMERVAGFSVPVLIHGETGSGKELVARAVHQLSRRGAGPFVAVNCGAIHGETAHSRLFGHERGAFTGAEKAALGAFREAEGGTLFLDEIAELSLSHQTALLRVLELAEVVPLGASAPVAVDYRLVAATHRELRHLVAAGRFREDLYFRLDVVTLRVPPLRERLADIVPLARGFLGELASGPAPALLPDAVELLLAHRWPGNVRELRATMLRALLAAESGTVGREQIVLRAARSRPVASFAAESPASSLAASAAFPTWELPDAVDPLDAERRRILAVLQRTAGNRKAAAEMLGIARSTLYARLRRLGLS